MLDMSLCKLISEKQNKTVLLGESLTIFKLMEVVDNSCPLEKKSMAFTR